jgi:hypothetical protein
MVVRGGQGRRRHEASSQQRRHSVAVTEQAVCSHADAAVTRLEELELLRRTGGLAKFNAADRAHRMAAEAAGKWFMTYERALARLRRTLAGAAAGGKLPELARVFDQ